MPKFVVLEVPIQFQDTQYAVSVIRIQGEKVHYEIAEVVPPFVLEHTTLHAVEPNMVENSSGKSPKQLMFLKQVVEGITKHCEGAGIPLW